MERRHSACHFGRRICFREVDRGMSTVISDNLLYLLYHVLITRIDHRISTRFPTERQPLFPDIESDDF